jgi:hypothetical protein
MVRWPIWLLIGLWLGGCGGASHQPNAVSADPAEAAPEPEKSEQTAESKSGHGSHKQDHQKKEAAPLPTDCAAGSDPCMPSPAFVEALCMSTYPGVALFLFSKKTSFTRGYLTRDTEAWNASGGTTSVGKLVFDEEVLILKMRTPPKGGMVVSGMGGYDALRWDGSCVTLATEELTRKHPPAPKAAKVPFKLLDDKIREALRADEDVNKAYKTRKDECKGAETGDVSLKCVKADTKLNDAIVKFVRDGGEIPHPDRIPQPEAK